MLDYKICQRNIPRKLKRDHFHTHDNLAYFGANVIKIVGTLSKKYRAKGISDPPSLLQVPQVAVTKLSKEPNSAWHRQEKFNEQNPFHDENETATAAHNQKQFNCQEECKKCLFRQERKLCLSFFSFFDVEKN